MAIYTIDFKHTKETKYTAVVEAEDYEKAMDLFEENPFDYVTEVTNDNDPGLYNVSKVTESKSKVVYENRRKLEAEYV